MTSIENTAPRARYRGRSVVGPVAGAVSPSSGGGAGDVALLVDGRRARASISRPNGSMTNRGAATAAVGVLSLSHSSRCAPPMRSSAPIRRKASATHSTSTGSPRCQRPSAASNTSAFWSSSKSSDLSQSATRPIAPAGRCGGDTIRRECLDPLAPAARWCRRMILAGEARDQESTNDTQGAVQGSRQAHRSARDNALSVFT